MNSRSIVFVLRAITPLISTLADVFLLRNWRRKRRTSNKSTEDTLWEEIPYKFDVDWFVQSKPREGLTLPPREGPKVIARVERQGGSNE